MVQLQQLAFFDHIDHNISELLAAGYQFYKAKNDYSIYYLKRQDYYLVFKQLKENNDALESLLFQRLAEIFKMSYIPKKYVILKDKKFELSLDYRKKEAKYINALTVIKEFYLHHKDELNQDKYIQKFTFNEQLYTYLNNVSSLQKALLKRYPNLTPEHMNELTEQLKKRVLFDYFIMNDDDNAMNITLEERKNRINVIPMYDMDNIFLDNFNLSLAFYDKIKPNDIRQKRLFNMICFLAYEKSEMLNVFAEYMDKFTIDLVKTEIEKIEDETKYEFTRKDEILNNVKNNLNELAKILQHIKQLEGRSTYANGIYFHQPAKQLHKTRV